MRECGRSLFRWGTSACDSLSVFRAVSENNQTVERNASVRRTAAACKHAQFAPTVCIAICSTSSVTLRDSYGFLKILQTKKLTSFHHKSFHICRAPIRDSQILTAKLRRARYNRSRGQLKRVPF